MSNDPHHSGGGSWLFSVVFDLRETDMRSIKSLYDLEEFGIIPLTGEACSLNMRVLCDLTKQGCEIFQECYGLKGGDIFQDGVNSGVASIMLPREAWQSLGVFALLSNGCHSVLEICFNREANFMTTDCLSGLKGGDRFIPGDPPRLIHNGGHEMDWPSCYGRVIREYRTGDHPHVGTKNIHAMSGCVL